MILDILLKSVHAVTPTEILEGVDILIQDGHIARIDTGIVIPHAYQINGVGLLAIPGIIDLHSDAVEKWIQPRPGGRFNVEVALTELDKYLASCGITTIYHCFCFGDTNRVDELRRGSVTRDLTHFIHGMHSRLGINNRIHARYDMLEYEFSYILKSLIQERRIQLFSIMNHAPGQGQFTSLDHFTAYYSQAAHLSFEETAALAERRIRLNNNFDDSHVLQLTSLCREQGIPMASHDDDTKEKVQWVRSLGVDISEFPVRRDAAQKARTLGMDVLMGAPNVLRGESLTNNLSGREAIKEGFCNMMGSDYSPMSMIHAVFALHRVMGIPLHEAVNMVTLNPAKAVGEENICGAIQEGLMADLVLVDASSEVPRIIKTFVHGREVFSTCRL
ncbi:MAG: alpha-D-ribose 1-methylphosphonate 5-triphosphate diphosphatase [Deltaproteobacteria bacterium]|nr:alpha-D-ribose 1-methylphosphonate 5-triphosphate diphosphatase [Deltaproteobacteria bacterium]